MNILNRIRNVINLRQNNNGTRKGAIESFIEF